MAKKKSFRVIPEHKELFKDVAFLVEATFNEKFLLWKTEFENPSYESRIKTWEDEGLGHIICIGELDKRPVCVGMFYAVINGKKVMFYEATSQVVDYKMIEDWLRYWTKDTIRWDNGTRWGHCDSMNFHHCIDAITEKGNKKNEKRFHSKSDENRA